MNTAELTNRIEEIKKQKLADLRFIMLWIVQNQPYNGHYIWEEGKIGRGSMDIDEDECWLVIDIDEVYVFDDEFWTEHFDLFTLNDKQVIIKGFKTE